MRRWKNRDFAEDLKCGRRRVKEQVLPKQEQIIKDSFNRKWYGVYI
ncbi:MAG: hypothetical protein NZO16_00775 [Deltaproteobacteria bacterium]|nr:hypothetical protein [Deltaproteobacteria bacterium]